MIPDSVFLFGAVVFLMVFLWALSMCQMAADADADLEEAERDWLWPGRDGDA